MNASNFHLSNEWYSSFNGTKLLQVVSVSQRHRTWNHNITTAQWGSRPFPLHSDRMQQRFLNPDKIRLRALSRFTFNYHSSFYPLPGVPHSLINTVFPDVLTTKLTTSIANKIRWKTAPSLHDSAEERHLLCWSIIALARLLHTNTLLGIRDGVAARLKDRTRRLQISKCNEPWKPRNMILAISHEVFSTSVQKCYGPNSWNSYPSKRRWKQ